MTKQDMEKELKELRKIKEVYLEREKIVNHLKKENRELQSQIDNSKETQYKQHIEQLEDFVKNADGKIKRVYDLMVTYKNAYESVLRIMQGATDIGIEQSVELNQKIKELRLNE